MMQTPLDDHTHSSGMEERLVHIFTDAIVLDDHFKIKTLSQSVLSVLKYSSGDLVGKDVGALLENTNDMPRIIEQLQSGSFGDFETRLKANNGRAVLVCLSGFYLHLITNVEECIILKVKSLEELELAYLKLQQKTYELDHFIYRASHDLRGPVATILGLINLARLRKDDTEVNLFFDLIAVHAEKLDHHLRDLVKTITH
jgi:signal transduction histidine kinase